METNADAVKSVSEKLHAFAEGLSDDERAVVDLLVAKALEEDEVSGFNFDIVQPVGIGRPNFQVPSFEAQLGNLFDCKDGTGHWCRVTVKGGGGKKLGQF